MKLLKKRYISFILITSLVMGFMSIPSIAHAEDSKNVTMSANSVYSTSLSNFTELTITFKTSPGAGAYSIYSTGEGDSYVTLADSNGKKLYSDDNSGSGSNFKLVADLGYVKTYKLYVNSKSSTKKAINIYIYEHKDTATLSNGGSWTPSVMKNDPDTIGYAVNKITFLTAKQAEAIYYATYEDVYNKLRDGTYKLLTVTALNYALGGAPAAVKAAIEKITASKVVQITGQVLGSFEILQLPTLTDLFRSGIKSASNNFKNGVKVISQTSGTNLVNSYESWNSTKAEGSKRYKGTFNSSDISILWR